MFALGTLSRENETCFPFLSYPFLPFASLCFRVGTITGVNSSQVSAQFVRLEISCDFSLCLYHRLCRFSQFSRLLFSRVSVLRFSPSKRIRASEQRKSPVFAGFVMAGWNPSCHTFRRMNKTRRDLIQADRRLRLVRITKQPSLDIRATSFSLANSIGQTKTGFDFSYPLRSSPVL